MFFHQFKYSLKALFRDRMLIFWTFAFPIILGTFFQLAFSNIENSERMDIIDIAVVENDALTDSPMWRETLDALSEGDDALFCIRYTDADGAARLLADDEVAGCLTLGGDAPRVTVRMDGIDQTVFKYVVDQIAQTETIAADVIERELSAGALPSAEFFEGVYRDVAQLVSSEDTGIRDTSPAALSYTMIEFYTLIAMVCLYGGLLGMIAVSACLANMSSKGKRVAVGPTRKGTMVMASMLAGYITQLVGVALLYAYTILVLHVDYGDKFALIVLLSMAGSLAGLALGAALAVLLKTGEGTKVGVMLSVTMFGCFLSGMMGITMKYIVDKNLPWVNRVNPANLITDGLYSLYYYDTLDRYVRDVVSLLVFAGIMLALAVVGLRRQKYDSI